MIVVSVVRLRISCSIELIRSYICWLMEDCTMFSGTCWGTILTTAWET